MSLAPIDSAADPKGAPFVTQFLPSLTASLMLQTHCGSMGLGAKPGDQIKNVWATSLGDPWKILDRLQLSGLAVVGTRLPSHASLVFVSQVLSDLKRAGLIVVSGLAYGIDAQVHRVALSHRIPTVAVLAGGLDRIYPSNHESLARDIVEQGGVLISEQPLGKRARKSDFLRRNRIIAGWARATWIVEAPFKSGAMNTAAWARGFERDLYVTPSHPADPTMEGNRWLLSEGRALPVTEARSFGSTWPELAATDVSVPLIPSRKIDGLEKQVLSEIQWMASRHGEVRVMDLECWALEGGCGFLELQKTLKKLEKNGHIVSQHGELLPL